MSKELEEALKKADQYLANPEMHKFPDCVLAKAYRGVKAQLDDITETYHNIVNSPCDEREVHCSCVPALRAEIERLKKLEEG